MTVLLGYLSHHLFFTLCIVNILLCVTVLLEYLDLLCNFYIRFTKIAHIMPTFCSLLLPTHYAKYFVTYPYSPLIALYCCSLLFKFQINKNCVKIGKFDLCKHKDSLSFLQIQSHNLCLHRLCTFVVVDSHVVHVIMHTYS